jgi:hypothetical protein
MQVHCKFYGLINASSGVECTIERDRLEVGESFQHRDQEYIIMSVVESQGHWYANVVPEFQRRFARRPLPALRLHNNGHGAAQETLESWRERATRAEHKVQVLCAEREHFGERFDHLLQMLELLTKDPAGPQ